MNNIHVVPNCHNWRKILAKYLELRGLLAVSFSWAFSESDSVQQLLHPAGKRKSMVGSGMEAAEEKRTNNAAENCNANGHSGLVNMYLWDTCDLWSIAWDAYPKEVWKSINCQISKDDFC